MSKISSVILRGQTRTFTHDQRAARLDRHLVNNPVPYRGNQMVKAFARAAIREYDSVISGKQHRVSPLYDIVAAQFARM